LAGKKPSGCYNYEKRIDLRMVPQGLLGREEKSVFVIRGVGTGEGKLSEKKNEKKTGGKKKSRRVKYEGVTSPGRRMRPQAIKFLEGINGPLRGASKRRMSKA